MKTSLLSLIGASVLLMVAPARAAQPSPQPTGPDCAAYVVADAASGYLLDASNPKRRLQIGSITKVATAMVVLDWAELGKKDLSEVATIPPSAVAVGGSNPVGFQPGDRVALRDLLYAALLQSDNIAAHTLAVHVGRTLPQGKIPGTPEQLFVAQMNALARKLGMKRTTFLNPHGLDDVERPYSTAGDLALLTQYAMSRSSFRFYVSQQNRSIVRRLSNGETIPYRLINTNELLGRDGIDGVKTGRTGRAGECVVVSAARSPESLKNADGSLTVIPRRLIVVVLGANNRFQIADSLLNHGWQLYDAWAAAGRPLKD
jgi:D-alanyl-D-alanine carboxypeptidase (penicillin-binding protein 5/6)